MSHSRLKIEPHNANFQISTLFHPRKQVFLEMRLYVKHGQKKIKNEHFRNYIYGCWGAGRDIRCLDMVHISSVENNVLWMVRCKELEEDYSTTTEQNALALNLLSLH